MRRINLGKVKFSFNFDLGGLSKNYYCVVFLSYMQILVDVVIFFLVVGESKEKVLLVFCFSFFLFQICGYKKFALAGGGPLNKGT